MVAYLTQEILNRRLSIAEPVKWSRGHSSLPGFHWAGWLPVAAEIPGRDLHAKVFVDRWKLRRFVAVGSKNAITSNSAHDLPKMKDAPEESEANTLLRMLLN
jgi:hypothetical protein